MKKIFKILFVLFFIKPVCLILLGLNIKGYKNLPKNGPAIIVANHNSHLDTIVLLSLFPLLMANKIKPVAAADYFCKNKFIKFFTETFLGIVPIDRNGGKIKSFFVTAHKLLEEGNILIIFPEGSRGEPHKLGEIKKGISLISKNDPLVPVIPVVLYGLGKSLPRGEALFVPFNCDVVIGEPIFYSGDNQTFLTKIKEVFEHQLEECLTRLKSY